MIGNKFDILALFNDSESDSEDKSYIKPEVISIEIQTDEIEVKVIQKEEKKTEVKRTTLNAITSNQQNK